MVGLRPHTSPGSRVIHRPGESDRASFRYEPRCNVATKQMKWISGCIGRIHMRPISLASMMPSQLGTVTVTSSHYQASGIKSKALLWQGPALDEPKRQATADSPPLLRLPYCRWLIQQPH